jgi:radical SAM superfamily enzyme YgiQ (UPF0313 family)
MIADLRARHGVREFLIEDDTFVTVRARVRAFCEKLLASGLRVSWSCLGRADRVDLELLKLMRRAGCWHVSFGIESGDPAILEAMHKHLDLEQIRQALAWCRQAGLRSKGFFIVGFPNETRQSLDRTRRFARSLPLDDISVMQMTPFPGSELYAVAGQYGAFEPDWQRMSSLETVFVPNGFTREDMDSARAQMIRAFYLRPGVVLRHASRVLADPRLLLEMGRGLGVMLKLLDPFRWRGAGA